MLAGYGCKHGCCLQPINTQWHSCACHWHALIKTWLPFVCHAPVTNHLHVVQAPLQLTSNAARNSNSHGSAYTTVLLLDHQGSLHDEDTISTIAWGGGPHYLLAAATKQSICIFSLEPF